MEEQTEQNRVPCLKQVSLDIVPYFNGVQVRTPCWYTEFFVSILYMVLFVFLLFRDGSPSWRNSLFFGLLFFPKASLKCLWMKFTNISPLIFPKYCWHKITPILKGIATIKCTVFPNRSQHNYPLLYRVDLNLHFVVAKSYFWLIWLHQQGYTYVDSLLHPIRMIFSLSRYFS